jgi:hypothetical protein
MNGFLFNLDQQVKLVLSDEEGVVDGRCEYRNDQNRYYIIYKAADGRQCSGWFSESEIIAAE